MKCKNCGASIESRALFCGYCGTTSDILKSTGSNASMASVSAAFQQPESDDDSDLKAYYRREFSRLDSNPSSRVKFNWAAFFFGILWYLYHGMWAKALIMLVIALGTGFIANVFLMLYSGFRGNYDFWLLRRQGKQLW